MLNKITDFVKKIFSTILDKENCHEIENLVTDDVAWVPLDADCILYGKTQVLDHIKNHVSSYQLDLIKIIEKLHVRVKNNNEYLVFGLLLFSFNQTSLVEDTKVRFTCNLLDLGNEKFLLTYIHFSFTFAFQNMSIADSNKYDRVHFNLDNYIKFFSLINDSFFEYSVLNQQMMYSKNFNYIFDNKIPLENNTLFTDTEFFKKVHDNDKPLAEKTFYDVVSSANFKGIVVRIQNKNNNYSWYKVRFVSVVSIEGTVYKVIASIVDVDYEMQNYESLNHKLSIDYLTGLLNKEAISSLIKKHLAEVKTDASLLIIDIDNFKEINDTLGHYFGDDILIHFANILKKIFNKGELLGRIGGDEFMIFNKISSKYEIFVKCNEFINEINKTMLEFGENKSFTCSIGIAFYPSDGLDFNILYQRADKALYYSKRQGKNQFSSYDSSSIEHTSFEDKTNVITIREDLSNNTSFIERLSNLSFKLLYRSKDVNTVINYILQLVLLHFNLIEVKIYEMDESSNFINTFRCTKENLSLVDGFVENAKFNICKSYLERIIQGDELESLKNNLPIFSDNSNSVFIHLLTSDTIEYGYLIFEDNSKNVILSKERTDSIYFTTDIIDAFLIKNRIIDKLKKHGDNLKTIYDNQNTIVYVINTQTFEIVYFNKYLQEILPNVTIGEKCYNLLSKGKTKCELCPVSALKNKKNGVFELKNSITQKWYSCEVSKITLDGVNCALLCVKDINHIVENEFVNLKDPHNNINNHEE